MSEAERGVLGDPAVSAEGSARRDAACSEGDGSNELSFVLSNYVQYAKHALLVPFWED